VTFFGVPVLPPGTSNQQRTFRITNVRINATGFSAAVGNVNPVLANVASNNALPLATPTNTVGYVQGSLKTGLYSSTSTPAYSSILQCTGKDSGGYPATATLQYTELFSSAFKTRSVPLTSAQYSAQSNNATPGTLTQNYAAGYGSGSLAYSGYGSGQSVPGALFSGNPININSESDFIFPIAAGGCGSSATTTACAGLADFGTRFKAVFTNVPAGVTVYVAVSNNTVLTGAPAGNSTTAYAQLVSSELAPEVSAAVTGTATFGGGTSQYLPLVTVNGSATAVWEVITANPNAIDTFSFPVYFGVTKNTTPAPSAAFVQLWYAPTSNGGANYSTTGALTAQGYGFPIPRFIDYTGTPSQVLAVVKCQTALLWPYVVTGATSGFETGLAISNTTTDPFGTAAQNGSCNLYWYGQNSTAAGAAVATATPVTYGCDQVGANASSCVGIGTTNIIASGTTWSNIASNLQAVPAGDYWVGYVIGVCNFQMAHGYAAITDISVRNIISSYLALVLEGPNSAQQAAGFIARSSAPVSYEGNEQ
jgi:hypothetical protein